MQTATKNLKTVLRSNAVFSGFSGLALLLAGPQIAELIGATIPWILYALGGGLLFFALTVWMAARPQVPVSGKVRFIVIQDALWVLGSIAILAFQWLGLNSKGYILIAIVAAVVALFGGLQFYFLKKG